MRTLWLLSKSYRKMENALCLNPSNFKPDMKFNHAIRFLYGKCLENKNHYLWYTCWIIVLKEINTAIGTAGFHGMPNGLGAVEIGYRINQGFQQKGYATETAGGLIQWAFSNKEVAAVHGVTEKSNIASQKVLSANNMQVVDETKNMLIWCILRKDLKVN